MLSTPAFAVTKAPASPSANDVLYVAPSSTVTTSFASTSTNFSPAYCAKITLKLFATPTLFSAAILTKYFSPSVIKAASSPFESVSEELIENLYSSA